MSEQVVKVEAQLLPQVDEPALHVALANLDKHAAVLPDLRKRAEALKVVDAASYQDGGALLNEARAVGRAPAARLSLFEEVARRVSDFFKERHARVENETDAIEEIIVTKLKAWKKLEDEAAAKEQQKLNKKANGDHVTVRPNVPTVPGFKPRKNFKFKVVNPDKVKKDFLTPDLKAIGDKVRNDKDPKLSMKEIGGIDVWEA